MTTHEHLPQAPADRPERRRSAARPAVRICAPGSVNAAFVTELSGQSSGAVKRGAGAELLRRVGRLRPRLGRRLKLAAVLVAVTSAVLLAGVSVTPDGDGHDVDAPVGTSSIAQAGPFDDCGFMQFACDAIETAIGTIGGLIADGLEALVGDAINPNNFCDRTEMTPDRPDTGFSGFILSAAQNESEFFEEFDPNVGTTWSSYGAAGTTWNTYFLDCLNAANIVNYAANAVFGVSKIVSVIAIVIFQQTFNSGLLNIFLGEGQGGGAPVQQIIDSLEAEIYVNLSALAIVIGALVMAYRAIIKGFGLADFLSKFLVMVVVSGLAVVFFNNAIPWIKWGNEQTNALTETVMTALRGNECTNAQGEQITLTPVNCTAETIYNTLVYVPWANGEVGSISATNGEGNTGEEKAALARRVLNQQAFTWADVSAGGDNLDEELRTKADEKLADRDKMVIEDWGAKIQPEVEDDGDPNTPLPAPGPLEDFNPDGVEGYSSVVMTNQSQTVWQMWSGGEGGERFAIAVMAIIAAFSFGLMLITIAIAYLVLQIATVLFALVAPLAFLVALVPVYGMRIFLKWAELFLGTFIKRIAMVVFVALLLTLYQVILDTDGVPWWLQMVLILAIAIGGASYRKKLTSLSTLGFGGGAGMGLGSSSAKAAAVRNTWQDGRGLSLPDRVIAAGRAGAHAGGGGSGVRSGGLINQRSGSQGRDRLVGLRGSGRSGAPVGYAPHPAVGSSRGSYAVPGRDGRDGRAGRDRAPGGAGRDGLEDPRLQRQLDQVDREVRYAGVGNGGGGYSSASYSGQGGATGRASAPSSSRGTYAPYVAGPQQALPPARSTESEPPPRRQPRRGDRGMGNG